MRKMLIIEICQDCLFSHLHKGPVRKCWHPDLDEPRIVGDYDIRDWCPLPDAPKPSKKGKKS